MSHPEHPLPPSPSGSAHPAVPAREDTGPGALSQPSGRPSTLRRARKPAARSSRLVTPPEPSPVAPYDDDRWETLARAPADARRRLRRAEEALAEQRLLAREADHRVANALQLVHGALSLQAAAAPEGEAREAIRAAARSVAAAAEAHRHLHTCAVPQPVSEVTPDAVAYLADLVRNLTPSPAAERQAASREVALRVEPGAARVVTAGLLPRLGLITAELITNALKHGAGPVLVELRPGSDDENGGIVVAVSDQGPGFPASFSPAANCGASLGMRLLVTLARPGRVWVDPADRRRILVQLKDRAPGSI